MNTALLVIDVQNDYFTNGKMELDGSLEASINIKVLLENFRKEQMPIIHIQHLAVKEGATFFIPNTFGAEIHENVKPAKNEKVIIKNFPNSFRGTDLDEYLKANSITKLIVVGMMTHMCIDTTVRAAYDLGYECAVVSDCCATKKLKLYANEVSSRDVQNGFLAALNGTFAKVLKTSALIELLK